VREAGRAINKHGRHTGAKRVSGNRCCDEVMSGAEYRIVRWRLSSGGHSADPLAGHDEQHIF
jgi:hypothetical protein